MNPIQAMKQRKAQQQQEAEERRLEQLAEAEERLARVQGGNSQPQSPVASTASPTKAPTLQVKAEILALPSPRATPSVEAFKEDMRASYTSAVSAVLRPVENSQALASAEPAKTPVLTETLEWPGPEEALTPLERRQLRQAVPNSPRVVPQAMQKEGDILKASGFSTTAGSGFGVSPSSATQRLQDRIRQRETNGKSEQRSSSRPPTGSPADRANGTTGWKDRIEARQKEAEVQQEQELEDKQRTVERSTRRNDAMKRVMERQAQRQQEVESLEA